MKESLASGKNAQTIEEKRINPSVLDEESYITCPMKTGTLYTQSRSTAGIPLPDLVKLVKKLSCLLACLFQIMPFSVWAGEVSAFSGNAPLPMPVNASRPNDPDIWLGGVGEGFRSGTQVLGFSAGSAYGMLMFGSKERHHLALTSVSYGLMVGGLKGADWWYRGNWELRGELFGGAQFNSETRWLTGVAPHLRYNFATGTCFIPYADIGAGVTLTEIRAPDLGGSFQFNLQANVGVNYFVQDDMAISIEGRYLHLSSSAISMPNNGVNTLGIFLGVNAFF
ncbi:MAG: acyloxyacyl hydrolase [Syntrophales bacterium]|jgi:opacity protein-like surface antigen